MEVNQYMLTDKDVQEIQKIEKEMLVEFDRICRKHNIIYSIDGGTLLGAVRHGGFIPWDDDADVIMVRREYDKLVKVIDNELDSNRFYFQSIDNTPGYRWGYSKLRRKNTEFVRLKQEHMPYEQGVFMDIFICDNVPDFYINRCICNFVSFLFRKMLWSEVGKKQSKGIAKKVYEIISAIPENVIKDTYIKFVACRNKKYTKWVKCLTFPACNRTYGYKREWYEDVEDIRFEDVVLLGAKKKEEYLSFLYGDYMKIPQDKDRKIHPVSKFNIYF